MNDQKTPVINTVIVEKPIIRSILLDHRVSDLRESGDIRTMDVVAFMSVGIGSLDTSIMDALHDAFEMRVDLVSRPLKALAGLRHLEHGKQQPHRHWQPWPVHRELHAP